MEPTAAVAPPTWAWFSILVTMPIEADAAAHTLGAANKRSAPRKYRKISKVEVAAFLDERSTSGLRSLSTADLTELKRENNPIPPMTGPATIPLTIANLTPPRLPGD